MNDILDQILKLKTNLELEAAGNQLNLSETHALFETLNKQSKESVEKLSPILVGMPLPIFYSLLSELDPSEYELLKEICPTEALQHKLFLLANDWKLELENLTKRIIQLQKHIAGVNLDQLNKKDIFKFKNSIDFLDERFEERNKILDSALTLAWNTTRTDLIDALSHLKDLYKKVDALLIGHASLKDKGPTGLYKNLEERLNMVYSWEGEEHRLTPLQDSDPAIEALASLGIYYLEDYFELGLLPDLKSPREIRENLQHSSEKKITLEQFIETAKQTLSLYGFKDVKSLKDAKIYSKEMLKEHINKIRLI